MYVAELEEPITFRMPIMDVYHCKPAADTNQENKGVQKETLAQNSDGKTLPLNNASCWSVEEMLLDPPDKKYTVEYIVDVEDLCCNKLMEFLYKLDHMALQSVEEHSLNWFGKHISAEDIVKKYVPPYDTDSDENIILRVQASAKQKLKSQKYNNHYCIISIEGLQFYKKHFVYSLRISKVVKLKDTKINDEMIDSLADYDNDTGELDLVASSVGQPDANTNVISQSHMPSPSYFQLLSKNWGTGRHLEHNTVGMTSLVSSVSKEGRVGAREELDSEKMSTCTMSRSEIQSLIEQTKQEVSECFTAAEKASRVAESLRFKAVQKANELKNIESMLF